MQLKPNMYVRTDKGYIFKIKEFKKHYTKGTRRLDFCKVIQVEENYLLLDGKQCEFIESVDYSIPPCYPSDEELEKIKNHIIKASYNIIDLIEVGDYVNGYKVTRISGTLYDENDLHCYCDESWNKDKRCLLMIPANEIESIVTLQQFESMSYKVGE